MSKVYFTITNSHGSFPITSAMYQKLIKKKKMTKYLIDRLAYKARNTIYPYGYMITCIERGWLNDSLEMERNPQAVNAWIDQVINKIKPEKPPEQVIKGKMPETIGKIMTEWKINLNG